MQSMAVDVAKYTGEAPAAQRAALVALRDAGRAGLTGGVC